MFMSFCMMTSAMTPLSAAVKSTGEELVTVEQNFVAALPYGTDIETAKAALPSYAAGTVLDTTAFASVPAATYSFDSGIDKAWNLLSSSITASGGKMRFASASNIKATVGRESLTDYAVECDIALSKTVSSNAGIIFRTTDATNAGADSYNGYYVGMGKVGSSTGFIIGYADGKWHQVATKAYAIAAETEYTLRILVYGSSFYVLVKTAAAADSAFELIYKGEQTLYANGNVGLRAYQQAFTVDNFGIRQLTDTDLAMIGITRTKQVTLPISEWTAKTYDGNTPDRYEFIGTLGKSEYVNPKGLTAKAVVTVQDVPSSVSYTHSVPFSQVTVEDAYWSALQKQFICQVIPVAMQNISTQTGGMENFRLASEYLAGKTGNYTTENAPAHGGAVYVDSDDYKVIEAMCYALQLDAKGDEEILAGQAAIKAQLEEWIPWIVGSQEADGYLYTAYTLTRDGSDMRFTGRSDDMPVHTDGSLYNTVGTAAYNARVNFINHELYCAGHFYEAAVAHYRATGDFRLLDVAVKNADLVVRTFGTGAGQVFSTPGHQEIELALIKLANLCTEIGTVNGADYVAKAEGYITTARFFLDAKGLPASSYMGKILGSAVYFQNDAPVAEQTTAHGHAVRANYMYTAMADVALLEVAAGRENPYDKALNSIWKDMLTKMYITGGIGLPAGESYGQSYQLPNDGAYCETCAQISNVMWNQRMNLLYGDSKYADLMEWTLYNSVMSCINFDGDRFFYQNHLMSESDFTRSVWFGTACCPPNLLRTVASIGGYIYTQDGEGNITVNQYIGNTAQLNVGGEVVSLSMESALPWDGDVALTVNQASGKGVAIRFRIPEWAKGNNAITLNGAAVSLVTDADGYVVIDRVWAAGDKVVLTFPMEAERIYSDENVTTNVGLVAVRRGPILYCAESVDNPGADVLSVTLPTDAKLEVSELTKLPLRTGNDDYNVENIRTVSYTATHSTMFEGEKTVSMTLIPYYAWNNRGYSDMSVYLVEGDGRALRHPLEYYAQTSASYTNKTDSLQALHDGSYDASVRWTSYNSTTTANWVEYAFEGEVTLRGSWVAWYDDGGGVQVPTGLSIRYWDGKAWKAVTGLTGTDNFPRNSGSAAMGEAYYGFDEIVTTKIRLYPTNTAMTQAKAQPGIIEWRLDGEVKDSETVLPKIYQAESGTRTGIATVTSNLSTNASAYGYVGTLNNEDASVTFSVYAPSAGLYNMEITYSGHTSYPRASHKYYLNGDSAHAQIVRYDKKSGWLDWYKKTVRVELVEGVNTVTFTYSGLSDSYARLDCIKLTQVVFAKGDINRDEKVSLADALTLLRNVASNTATSGDMNGDGKINKEDVTALLKTIAEKQE